MLDEVFNATVKSVDEFMARFNGLENKPSVANEGESRRNNILALFDYTMESRTSSPVRITRSADTLESTIAGLYPCGEGAGYAGGITSAAMDGLRAAEQIGAKSRPLCI